MTLSIGDTLRLITVDLAAITFTDWLSFRDAVPGDIARVLRIWEEPEGRSIQLICEAQPGFPEWGATFRETGLTYEVVPR
ncbi:hypothetical protein HU752_020165 [Pseudomonas vanderleydeniana]|uniref:Uncharacterized protein n=2 Tax=Pseudomonas vanderleydeniana TaxID=2745495 RepID=A0A9E6TV59_9PSED|nr:hypothetical protein HU752_020165 [Pseudomonas vanderleydeniana]